MAKPRLNPQTPAVTDPDLLRDADYQLTPEQEDMEEPGEKVIHEDAKNRVVERDGETIVLDAEPKESANDSDFYENLAERLTDGERETLALELLDLIERDIKAREKRDEQQAEGIRRTGLGDDAPGGANFNGASRVVHPALAEGCIDFAARAIKELFPPNGPVRAKIVGKQTPEKLKRAERKVQHMNFQLTQEVREYRTELEQLLTQLPLGGSQYLKIYWDPELKRARAEFIPIDDIILPYSAGEFYTSQRKTQRLYLTDVEYEGRVESGVYWEKDPDSAPPAKSSEPEPTKSAEATSKVDGRERTYYNEDGLRINYESYVSWKLPESIDGGKRRPYIVMLDEATYDVKGIYRNWDEEDDTHTEEQWIVDFTFIPWRGAQGVGLTHLIGTMSGAATGALRALLDTAHINNSATMLKLKSNQGAQNVNIDITGVTEIEGRAGIDDIRKMAMPLPFNPPSVVLYQLLDWLTIQMKGVVGTAEEKIADATNTMPVGTALALIEQGSQVFSAIHMRLHASQHMALNILHRLNRKHLDDERTIAELGELVVRRKDYEGPVDVIPVSDPNIFSETQRFAQVQAVRQMSLEQPQIFDQHAVAARFLETIRFPDPDSVLLPHFSAENVDPVEENVRMGLGRPVEAYKEQDQLAHINIHLSFMADPLFGSNLLVAPTVVQGMIGHLREHLLLWYQSSLEGAVARAAGVEDFEELSEEESTEARNAVARTLALAAMLFHDRQRTQVPNTVQAIAPQLLKLGQVAQEALKLIQPLIQAGQPQDPAVAVAQADVERRAKKDQVDAELEKGKLQLAGQTTQVKSQEAQAKVAVAAKKGQVEEQKLQVTAQATAAEIQRKTKKDERDAQFGALDIAVRRQIAEGRNATDRRNMDVRADMNNRDNMTAITLAAAEIESGEKVAVSTGTGINP